MTILVVLVGLTGIGLLAAMSGWMLFLAVTRGLVYSHRVAYSRESDPSSFWWFTACYSVMFLTTGSFVAYFGGGLIIDLLRR